MTAPASAVRPARLATWRASVGGITDSSLGWLPVIMVLAASGLVVVAASYTAGRFSSPWAPDLFWVGIVVLTAPIVIRMFSRSAGRRERLGLVALFGSALYLVKVLHDPVAFTFFDEFLHWRTANDIFETKHLFRPNNILPTSPYFPGLEVVTTALMEMGLPIFAAGTAVIAVARMLMALALFHFMEEVSGSARLAGIASVIYMGNPGFLFFDAQFSYESLALPLASFVLYIVARQRRFGRDTARMNLVLIFAIGAVIVTHHITAYFLAVFLALWASIHFVRTQGPDRWGKVLPAAIAVVGSLAWLLLVAQVAVGYLAPAVTGALRELLTLAAGESTSRQLFRSPSGLVAPLWEQLAGYLSVVLVTLALPVGIYVVVRRHRSNVAALALAVGALAYPVSLLARFTERGAEISARSAVFIFLPVVFVVAVAAVHLTRSGRHARIGLAAATAMAFVIVIGGFVVASPPWARIPGPYLVAADPRSVEPQGIAAAEWARQHLGADNRIMTDRTNRLLLATYGDQRPISAAGDRIDVKAVYFARTLGEAEIRILRGTGVRYVLIDRRLSQSLPYVGVYVERGEVLTSGPHRVPIDPAALAKFDDQPGVSRIFDSGDIQIYDVRGLGDE